VELAAAHAEHQWRLESELAAHRRRMDVRLWYAQMVAFVVGLIDVAALALVAWHYADTGNAVPGLAMFATGTGLTAGTVVAGRALASRSSSGAAKA
jgi:hypothetical protein